MKTSTQEHGEAIEAIRLASTTPRAIIALRQWLRLHDYEDISERNMRKSTLIQQKHLVEEIRDRYKSPKFAVQMLVHWLLVMEYEDSRDCDHILIARKTGKCNTCDTKVMEPIIIGSDEALAALREKLRGD